MSRYQSVSRWILCGVGVLVLCASTVSSQERAIPLSAFRGMNIDDITKVLATSRNERDIRAAWEGWHTISPPMKKESVREVSKAAS